MPPERVSERAEASGQPTGRDDAHAVRRGVAVALPPARRRQSPVPLPKGELQRLTRDQTMAQDLVDSGVLAEGRSAVAEPARHVLTERDGRQPKTSRTCRASSSSGATRCCSAPTASRSTSPIGRIAERMRTRTSAEQVVRALVDDALAGGGTDNVTVLVVAGVRKH